MVAPMLAQGGCDQVWRQFTRLSKRFRVVLYLLGQLGQLESNEKLMNCRER